MESPWILLANIVLVLSVIVLLVYGCCRAVRWARKGTVGGAVVGSALMFFSFGSAMDPAREVAAERRKLKRSEEGSGDPDPHSDDGELD